MSFRTTWILLGILVVLGAGVYFFEIRPRPEASSLDPNLQIWKLDKDAVNRVVTMTGGQEQIMEKRADGLWYLLPQDVRADYWRISGTLIRLSNMRGSRKITDTPRDLATYGLDQPKASLTLGLPDGESYTLLIGDKTPNDGGYYAKEPNNDTVWLVGTFNVEDIERFVKEPALEPTPSASPQPSVTAGTAASSTPAPGGTAAPPGLPTVGVPATPAP
jgi:hypothetical protein